MSEDTIKDYSKVDIAEAAKAGVTVVDFWAEWCGPCRSMIPVFHAVAEEYAGKATFAKVNVDNGPDNAAKFGIRSIPCFIVFKDGKVAATKVGAMRKDELEALVQAQL